MSQNIDHSTLNWVKEEIDETLKQAQHALEEYVENPGDVTQLRFTNSYIHQVHGTLKMVELFGATLLTEEMEKLTQALMEEKVQEREKAYEVLMRAIIQLPDYLEKIQSGLRDDPLILLPLINDLRTGRGEQAITDNSLFTPTLNTNVEVPTQVNDTGMSGQELAKKLRHNFQIGLLGFYRNKDSAGSLQKIVSVTRELEKACEQEDLVRFWWVSTGLVEALLEDNVTPSVEMNKMLGQIDRQVKRLIDRGEEQLPKEVSDDLLTEMLYFIARSPAKGDRVREIRDRFNLSGNVTDSEELEETRRSLGGPNLELMETVSVAVREYLTQVKDALDLFIRGERKNVNDLSVQSDVLHKIADTLGMLGLGVPRRNILDQDEIIQQIVKGEREPDDETLMQIADVLLKVESALERLAKQKSAEEQQEITADGVPDGKVKLAAGEMNDIQSVLLDEIAVNMAKIKDSIVSYIDNPSDYRLLEDVPQLFNEVRGGMKIINLNHPGALLESVSNYIRRELLEKKHQPSQDELDTLADAIASVEYYLEAIPEKRSGIDSMLKVAHDSLAKLGYPVNMDNIGVAESASSAEETVETEAADVAVIDSLDQITLVEEEVPAETELSAEDIGLTLDDVSVDESAADELVLDLVDDAAPAEVHEEEITLDLPAGDELVLETVEEEITLDPPAEEISLDMVVEEETPAPVEEESKEEREAKIKEASAQLLNDVDDDILAIFVEEAREVLDVIHEMLPEWKARPENHDALGQIRRGFHTLKGSGRLVGATEIGEFAWAFENMFNRVLDNTIKTSVDMFELIDEAVAALPKLIDTVETSEANDVDVDGLSDRAFAIANQEKKPVKPAPAPESRPAPTPPSSEVVQTLETAEARKARTEEEEAAAVVMDPVLYEIFSKESAGHIKEVNEYLEEARVHGNNPPVTDELIRALHTLHGSARMAGSSSIAEIAGLLEKYTKTAKGNDHPLIADGMFALTNGIKAIEQLLSQINNGDSPTVDISKLVEKLDSLYRYEQTEEKKRLGGEEPEPLEVVEETITIEATPVEEQVAEYDQELLEVFLEEAAEILDNSESILQKLKEDPADQSVISELQRELHTLKGGARMAGITAVGDLAHAVESLLTDISDGKMGGSKEVVDALHQVLDRLFNMIELVQQRAVIHQAQELIDMVERIRKGQPGETAAPVQPAVEEISVETPEEPAELVEFPVAPPLRKAVKKEEKAAPAARPSPDDMRPAAAASATGDVVRVKADLLDNLVNFAGEVSIYRARLEQQGVAFNTNLLEMGNTVTRLHEQLRKLEIETEAQVLYSYEKEGGSAEFDPLEMDRYSQVQELSRGLSESLNDITSIKNLLDNLMRESETLLLQQSRVNTDLQEGLMRTRMVPFSQITTRLHRIVRQTAKELNKKAELSIVGEQGEIDRTVLERITAPIEHMLRNAISHGIEEPAGRKALGKNEAGQLNIEIARHGSEVVLLISDDGAGLNLDAIRSKAIERGLLDPNSTVTEHDVMQYILESGFSTAETVSQISGRGVGMDVVNSEIKQLGGSLEIDSTAGKGTKFTVHLPLTLAMNHALLLGVGEELYAMPLSGIEGIVRVPRDEVERHISSPKANFKYGEHNYQMKCLSGLLGGDETISSADKVLPVLLIRSGDHRMALQVDTLLGSREIVVKSIGPQLSTVRGISGATILGDGRVVLILDMGAVIRLSAAARVRSAIQRKAAMAVKDEAKKPVIMVVDDSITVRKVTTRLLERNEMVAITAKDGRNAIEVLSEQKPDLMLLDIEMPKMDGFELATHMRNEPSLKDIPIIMITSRTGDKHRNRAMEIGVQGYMGKPYQEMDLMQKIKELLKETYGDA